MRIVSGVRERPGFIIELLPLANRKVNIGQCKERYSMKVKVKVKIADVVIQLQSDFSLEQLNARKQKLQFAERFNNFLYEDEAKPDIIIKVNIVDKLPEIRKARDVFIAHHPDDGSENWRLLKKRNSYIYKCPLKSKQQIMFINETFNKVNAYFLPKKDKGRVWSLTDIIYDFLQVLLINYFSLNKKGIFIHGIGVRDLDGRGLLFAGKSGAGKSTTARLWHKHSRAMVLNDDRIIVRKLQQKFFIYGSPWHGEFSDYLKSHIESAPITKLFFIYHSPKNTVRRISDKGAFSLLYPALFPTFWDKNCLENIVSFCQDLVKTIPCFKLGFVNNKKVIAFVRKI